MPEALTRITQALVGRIEFGVTLLGDLLIFRGSLMHTIGMNLRRERVKFGFERVRVQPRSPRLIQ